MAAANTISFYENGAGLLLNSAARQEGVDLANASPEDALAMLLQCVQTDKSVLASGTVCVYRQCFRTAINSLVAQGLGAEAGQAGLDEVYALLHERRGEPNPKRGASLKLEVPLKVELSDVFSLLKRRFFDEGENLDLVLALYLLVIPRLGLRPIEVTWARREGGFLLVPTAKRDGRPTRKVPLTNWPENFIQALDVLLALIPRELSPREFTLWRNALASRLARASRHTRTGRRLSLYCCRHIAVATWREIGMSPDEIAELAGHASLLSQKAYGRGRNGFGPKWLFADDLSPSLDTEHTHSPSQDVDLSSTSEAAASVVEEDTLPASAARSGPKIRGSRDAGSQPVGRNIGQMTEIIPLDAAGDDFVFDPFPEPEAARAVQADGVNGTGYFKALAEQIDVQARRYLLSNRDLNGMRAARSKKDGPS